MALYIDNSILKGAGKGLFTDSLIKRGEKVVEYTGDVITWKECERRNGDMKDGVGAYYFYISEKKCIDAQNHLDSMARYCNDANGFTKIPGLRNNARFEIIRGRVYIIASRNLKPSDEVFVAYGREYWDALIEQGFGPKPGKKK
ncbi:MAG: SET domain-containing protein [Bacteroidota bacterium]